MTWIETLESKAGAFTARFQKYGVANRLEKRSLLIAINAVASLSIFFFGYGEQLLTYSCGQLTNIAPDQGLMGGVNTNRNYASLMRFGQYDENEGLVQIDRPLLQGGIVSLHTSCANIETPSY